MKIRIPSKQVHRFDDVLQFDIEFPDFPDLPTHGMQIPLPTTKEVVREAIANKVYLVQQQMEKDVVIRNQFADLLDTDLTIEV